MQEKNGKSVSLGILISLIKGQRLVALATILLSLIEGMVEALILSLLANIGLNYIRSDDYQIVLSGIEIGSVKMGIIALLTLIFSQLILGVLKVILRTRMESIFVEQVRSRFVEAYGKASLLGQRNVSSGTMQQLVVSVPNQLSGHISSLISYVGNIFMMIAMVVYALTLDSRTTLLLIVAVFVATLAFRPLRSGIAGQARKTLTAQSELSTVSQEFVDIRMEAHVFGVNEQFVSSLKTASRREVLRNRSVNRRKGVLPPGYSFFTYAALVVMLIVLVSTPNQAQGNVGPTLIIMLRCFGYGLNFQQFGATLANLTPAYELLRTQVSGFHEQRPTWGLGRIERIESLHLSRVSFRYSGNEDDVVTDASLLISRGQKVGIVGASGSGKSTLTLLLLGLVEPERGDVLVNGKPLHSFLESEWRGRVGVVPQAPGLIRGTVAENLLLRRSPSDELALWRALEIANLRSEIEALPSGLDTLLGPGHRGLSGGQLQRLAIARAFVGDPDLVVMDEPTASIDMESEAVVNDAIGRRPSGVTVIVVSHREGILKQCDQIVRVDGGRIVVSSGGR